MAKAGEHAAPRCPICGRSVRLKPGTNRYTVTPLWQCKQGTIEHPEQGCEWTNAMLQMLLEEKAS
jgi:hypothetical protein